LIATLLLQVPVKNADLALDAAPEFVLAEAETEPPPSAMKWL
jgi:hypothetical protein